MNSFRLRATGRFGAKQKRRKSLASTIRDAAGICCPEDAELQLASSCSCEPGRSMLAFLTKMPFSALVKDQTHNVGFYGKTSLKEGLEKEAQPWP